MSCNEANRLGDNVTKGDFNYRIKMMSGDKDPMMKIHMEISSVSGLDLISYGLDESGGIDQRIYELSYQLENRFLLYRSGIPMRPLDVIYENQRGVSKNISLLLIFNENDNCDSLVFQDDLWLGNSVNYIF